jgi:hypothetical protein
MLGHGVRHISLSDPGVELSLQRSPILGSRDAEIYFVKET